MTKLFNHLSQPKYRPDIDGLRAVAVLSVVAFHVFPDWMVGGFIGVDVFFVISGFLISLIIFENLDKGTFSFTEFYVRRIKRIFPALLVVLSASYVLGWFALLADEYKQLGKHIAAGASFVSNLVLLKESGYFDNSPETKPLLHLWSLGIEEQFYIFWPVVLWLAWKANFNFFIITVLVAIVSFYLNLKGIVKDSVESFYSPQTRFWELLMGSLLAWFMLNKNQYKNYNLKIDGWSVKVVSRENIEVNGNTLSNIVSLVGSLFLIYGFWRITKNVAFPGKWAVIPVLGAVLIILAGPNAWINRMILSNKIAVWFGLISFPLYLWHWPLLSFARIVESEFPNHNVRIFIVALSVLLAWITYKLIEQPVRLGRPTKYITAALIVLMIVVGYAGYNTFERDGHEFRNSIKKFVNNKNELIRTPAIDSECLKYTGLAKPLFPYCRFTNANSDETVAVIGDSHAHVAYPGIAEYLRNKDVNTILLANSSCPPFIGSYTGSNQVEKDACRDRIEQLLDVVLKHKDIRRVFVFTRGPIYNLGTEPLTGSIDLTGGNNIPITEFSNSAQLSFNKLLKVGKSVFYVTENPELSYSAESCLDRPFRQNIRNCSVNKNSVLKRQLDYLSEFNGLKNITIINSLNAFCPHNYCIVFDDDGSLLYADDDHLSVAGSKFQVNNLLKEFLD